MIAFFKKQTQEPPETHDYLTVVTWDEDPYSNDEDGDLFLLCDGC